MIPRVPLGHTGLVVPRLCMGTGTSKVGIESVQSRQRIEALGTTMLHAHARGVGFWDTSDNYNTHGHVAWALARVPRADVVVTSKCFAATAEEAREAVETALRELGTPYLDIMLLHEVDEVAEFHEKAAAFAGLQRAKDEGLVRAIGLSTHAIDVLEAIVGHPDVGVILTNFNFATIHMDAGIRHYRAALQAAHDAGQGIMAMKTLGEGALADRRHEAIPYNLAQPFIDVVVVGMHDQAEVDDTVAIATRYLDDPAGHVLVAAVD